MEIREKKTNSIVFVVMDQHRQTKCSCYHGNQTKLRTSQSDRQMDLQRMKNGKKIIKAKEKKNDDDIEKEKGGKNSII